MTQINARIESIFDNSNQGGDCDTIAGEIMMIEHDVRKLLDEGKQQEAVEIYIHLLKASVYHYVSDEHYKYVENTYSPEYIIRWIIEDIL